MTQQLLTVEQAAQQLNLHPKTVLRYIHDGRLPATRVGNSYRILRVDLDTLAGVASGGSELDGSARTTCITDIPDITLEAAERMATFLQAVALTGNAGTPPLHLQTAFDPQAGTLKIIAIGSPSDVGKLLEMMHLQMRAR